MKPSKPAPKGYKNRPEDFYQPSEASAGEPCPQGPIGSKGHWNEINPLHKNETYKTHANYLGDGHDFNIDAKVVSNKDSDYHDFGRKDSGLHGNFAEKDASINYLRERGKKGQVLKSWTGTNENSRLHSYNVGLTAYNSEPIDEVFKPATSHRVPPPDAIIHNYKEKPEQTTQPVNTKDVTKKLGK